MIRVGDKVKYIKNGENYGKIYLVERVDPNFTNNGYVWIDPVVKEGYQKDLRGCPLTSVELVTESFSSPQECKCSSWEIFTKGCTCGFFKK